MSDMSVTVKARELQRALLAEMSGDHDAARRHFLAAAHLEMVLAADYERGGDSGLAFRSRISAASCLWRGGQPAQAQSLLDSLLQSAPDRTREIRTVIDDLSHHYPNSN